MVGCIVFHNTFGSGTIISKTANLLVIDFNGTEKKFVLQRLYYLLFSLIQSRRNHRREKNLKRWNAPM